MFLKTANDSKYLETLAGIKELMDVVDLDNIIACGDDDDF